MDNFKHICEYMVEYQHLVTIYIDQPTQYDQALQEYIFIYDLNLIIRSQRSNKRSNWLQMQGWLYENIGNHTFVRYKPYFEGSNHTFIIILRICKENNISHFISKPYSDHTFDLQTILIWSNHTYNHPWTWCNKKK